jgi:branched-chain amino acid transport system substrate-binding protein
VILIGHYGSMTGSEATFGQSTDNGIRLALKEINAQGGINGKKVELITYDTKGVSEEAGKAVTRLVTNDKVVAVLGEVASSLSLAGGAVCQQYRVPMVSPSSTNPRVTQGRDYVFRVCFTDDFQAYGVAKFIRENLKLTRAAVLYDQKQAYSKGLRDYFTKSFTEMGGTVVIDQAYSGGDTDYSAQLTAIKAKAPEIVFIPGYYTDGASIAIQARKAGVTVPLIGGDGWDSEQLGKIAGEAIVGCYFSNHSAPDQPSMQEFIGKYRAAHSNQVPDALAGLGYDAANLLFEAIKRSKSLSGPDLRDAIAATRDFPGVTGKITIDKNRNAQKALVIVQMKKDSTGAVTPSFVAGVEAGGK